MKYCTKCGTQCDDTENFCTNCGNPFNAAPQGQTEQPAYSSSTDHTAEFDPRDISDNKVVAMLPYLLGPIGIIIALLMVNTSEYVKFHVYNALKITVVETLLGIIAAILFITVIVPIVAGICILICGILSIIAFFDVCNGKAKEAPIICNLKFLK